jgi:8-oxo-dGTP diphosphatase
MTSVSAVARRFCWRCGTALAERPPTACGSCGQGHFNNPKPAADAVLVHDGRVLLARRAQDPWRDRWDIPGGFCDAGEHPILTAERELMEETGMRGRAVTLIGTWIDTYGEPQPDGIQETTLNLAYLVRAQSTEPSGPLDHETVETAWFPLDGLPDELAFPTHAVPALAATRELLRRPTLPPLQRPPSVVG